MNQTVGWKWSMQDLGKAAAAAGVVVSLLLVAYEVRQSNAVARMQVRQDLTGTLLELNAWIAEDPDIAELLIRITQGDEGVEAFSSAEVMRLSAFFAMSVRGQENLWLAIEEGLIDEGALRVIGGYVVIDSEFFRAAWPRLRPAHAPAFVAFLEAQPWHR